MKPDPRYSSEEKQAQRIAYLVAGYLQGSLSTDEHDELDAWITASHDNQLLFEELTDPAFLGSGLNKLYNTNTTVAYNSIKSRLNFTSKKKKAKITGPYAIAAALILFTGLFLLYRFVIKDKAIESQVVQNFLLPGSKKAFLTLSNGTVIDLASHEQNVINEEGGIVITKSGPGQLNYSGVETNDVSMFNTLTIPPGGAFNLVLPDGSKVWLNAATSLRYPLSFDNNRVVELTGEAYFEITPALSSQDSKRLPFTVKSHNTTVSVLGTHFNVNAYRDEGAIITTVLEGKVRIGSKTDSSDVSAGWQARVEGDGMIAFIEKKISEDVVAWKNDVFKFNNASIQQVMQQVARWYNAEIIYKGDIDYHFNATISRNEPVTKLLRLLEITNRVHFTVNGKQIIVRP